MYNSKDGVARALSDTGAPTYSGAQQAAQHDYPSSYVEDSDDFNFTYTPSPPLPAQAPPQSEQPPLL